MSAGGQPKLRVLVVDDSRQNQHAISQLLRGHPEIEVVGTASDGSEALKLVAQLRPDAVTADLEMPKVDGFSFLRMLMAARPTPVIIVSSYSQKENVFRALELGAIDFVAKPDSSTESLFKIKDLLIQKVMLVRSMRSTALLSRSAPHRSLAPRPYEKPASAPRVIVAIASSTGGPTALTEILAELKPNASYSVVVAQHMPEKFTATFAERLNRFCELHVTEAAGADHVQAHRVFICPGRQCMELAYHSSPPHRLRLSAPLRTDRYIPSGDRLLTSAAEVFGARAIGIILTGMGDDGVEGARAILAAGGSVIAESEETAVVYGMPRAAVRAGVVSESVPLPKIAERIAQLVSKL